MKTVKKTERITFLVSEEKKEEIEKIAENLNISRSGVVKMALSDFLKKQKQ